MHLVFIRCSLFCKLAKTCIQKHFVEQNLLEYGIKLNGRRQAVLLKYKLALLFFVAFSLFFVHCFKDTYLYPGISIAQELYSTELYKF